MRKKLNKFYWSYIIVSVVVIIVLAVFESTGFQMQENFKKDLRISLPDYTVEKIEKNDVCDSSDELIYAVKEYYILGSPVYYPSYHSRTNLRKSKETIS